MTSTVSPERGTAQPDAQKSVSGWAGRSPLTRLIVRRVLIAIPLLFAVSLLVFALLEAMPGDPARNQAGMEASEAEVEELRRRMGLDRPAHERYLVWLLGAFAGDLGRSSVSGQSVTSMLAERIPVTMEIVVLAFIVSLVIALPIALIAARRPGGIVDRVVMVISMTLLAVPNFVLALLLVLVFSVALRLLPAIGYVPIQQGVLLNLKSMLLPVLAIGVPLACFYTRFLRGDLVEQLNSAGYIDTARAKGVGPWKILWLHAFRNSSFGLLTLVGLNVGMLVGGTVIIEMIFAMPGMGMMMLQGAMSQDIAVVQACVFIFAAIAIFANLVVDVMYAILDPRVRHDS